MMLVKVKSHSFRDDLFINEIVASQDQIKRSEKIIIKRILLQEIALNA